MFVELNKKLRIPLEIGQLYLLGKQINALENKSKHFIELEAEEEIEQKHCVIDVGHSEDVYVYDLFSLNGSLLNDKPLKALEKIRLQNGDILKVGKQEIKYCHEQPEVSHDSSGFLEVNKNTSDIIASSPDSTSQTESRLKRHNYNKFLVPSIPSKKSITPNTSLVIPETEAVNISRNSLNASSTSLNSNSRRSDSFTIPETQYCKPRQSLNASDLSVAESIPEDNGNKIKYFDNINLEDDDDDFCIPETQEVLPSSQRPRILSTAKEKSILLEESSSTNVDDVEGSQFRICTQDYNEGFGEEGEVMQSQIIPFIKHNTVVLNASCNMIQNRTTNTSKNENSKNFYNVMSDEEEDKELSAVTWPDSKNDQKNVESKADCSTPDIFEFADIEQAQEAKETEKDKDKLLKEAEAVTEIEDEEDILPTQLFPLSRSETGENKSLEQQDKPCLDKEPEEVLTLSDKENRCPTTLEPITDLPPTQLFATNEVSSIGTAASSTSLRNSCSKTTTTLQPLPENKNNHKSINDLEAEDEEDVLLTQAFVPQSSNPLASGSTISKKNITNKCFNSTVLEEKFMAKNPHTFFAEMEKTPSKHTTITTPANTFKKPDKEITVAKKTSSAASTISDDLDLLMCTPQLIKDHVFVGKSEDLRKNILAAKNRNLFGDDTDDDTEPTNEMKGNEDDNLVMLFKAPKVSLDFEKLLPHLSRKSPSLKKEENAAKEANKLLKFNASFGKEQDEKRKSISKSSIVSRDERHSARDRERELAERKELVKNKRNISGSSNNSREHRRGKKSKETEENCSTSAKEDENDDQIRSREKRKRLEKDEKCDENTKITKLEENSKRENDKKQKSINKDKQKSNAKNDKSTEKAEGNNLEEGNKKDNEPKKLAKEDENEQKTTNQKEQRKRHTRAAKASVVSTDEYKVEEKPARRMTRAKSRADDGSTTSKDSNAKSKKSEETDEGDEMDSIATQPFVVRLTRRCSTAKQSESQQSSNFSNSSRKSSQNNKSKNDTAKSHNSFANGSLTSNSSGERKRKAEPIPAVVPVKIERKRLRSTHSRESATTSNANTTSSNKILISMTMVDQELFKGLVEKANGIWQVAKDPAESEILVMDKAFRTFKFLLAMARGIPIVKSEYLKKLNQTQSLKKVKISDYLFKDEEFEKKHKCSLVKSQQIAKKHKLFKDYEFLMTANILPNPKEIQAIILASGGLVHAKAPPAPKDNQHLYLITSKEDKKEWHKYRRLNNNIVIVSTEAIMSAIMRQTCESLSNYTLA